MNTLFKHDKYINKDLDRLARLVKELKKKQKELNKEIKELKSKNNGGT